MRSEEQALGKLETETKIWEWDSQILVSVSSFPNACSSGRILMAEN